MPLPILPCTSPSFLHLTEQDFLATTGILVTDTIVIYKYVVIERIIRFTEAELNRVSKLFL